MQLNTRYITIKMGQILLLIVTLTFGLLGYSSFAQAETNCSAISPESFAVAINAASYVGNELPVGSTIYRTTVNASHFMSITCNGPYSLPLNLSVINTPSGPSFPFTGMNYSNGPVFPTNVSGVGVAIWRSGTLASDTKPATVATLANSSNTGGGSNMGLNFDISLIKTGPIASGSVVNAASFPTAVLMVPATAGFSGLPLNLVTVNFTGSVNFTTSTCTTPDVNVNMGTYDIAQTFRQVGNVTSWVDSSITLQNCPTFSGRYADTMTNQIAPAGGGMAGGTNPPRATLLTVSLTPTSSIINAADGVIAVDSGQGPDLVARGVGLQLGYTPSNMNANATSPTTIWKPGAAWDMQPSNDGRNSFKIPLAARYFQTSAHVTPGPANTKVVFNIDYK
jgi:major type 1 subunit fimbrin (pilin)